ncbi:hypothetical protein PUN28_007634 [Cardiocondyla obscurior]|uniref:Uncharacterized protein n=1 Tax=Cardiocondyla obscurior TaxID=286306 RepID=A0AAW2G4L2_9HYME
MTVRRRIIPDHRKTIVLPAGVEPVERESSASEEKRKGKKKKKKKRRKKEMGKVHLRRRHSTDTEEETLRA